MQAHDKAFWIVVIAMNNLFGCSDNGMNSWWS
jgi:hypothetical protein